MVFITLKFILNTLKNCLKLLNRFYFVKRTAVEKGNKSGKYIYIF